MPEILLGLLSTSGSFWQEICFFLYLVIFWEGFYPVRHQTLSCPKTCHLVQKDGQTLRLRGLSEVGYQHRSRLSVLFVASEVVSYFPGSVVSAEATVTTGSRLPEGSCPSSLGSECS